MIEMEGEGKGHFVKEESQCSHMKEKGKENNGQRGFWA